MSKISWNIFIKTANRKSPFLCLSFSELKDIKDKGVFFKNVFENQIKGKMNLKGKNWCWERNTFIKILVNCCPWSYRCFYLRSEGFVSKILTFLETTLQDNLELRRVFASQWKTLKNSQKKTNQIEILNMYLIKTPATRKMWHNVNF